MMFNSKWVALLAGVALLATAPLVRSEISRNGEPAPDAVPLERALVPPGEQQLTAQCWQEGVKIIDQTGLQGLALTEFVKQQAVTFGGPRGERPKTLILPFADAICLIQPAR
jgi:hypothetical protein